MESPSPTIAVSIQTSSPTLNLTLTEPFVIRLALRLRHTSSITFDKRWAGLFSGKILSDEGFTFTNTETGEQVPRGYMCILYESSNNAGALTLSNRNEFVTLVPGQDHDIKVTFKPTLSTPLFQASGMTSSEIAEKQHSLPKAWNWPNVAGLKDGQTDKIGISNKAKVGTWREGGIGWLLMMRMLGLGPEVRSEVINYTVVETASFGVTRIDRDGGANWP